MEAPEPRWDRPGDLRGIPRLLFLSAVMILLGVALVPVADHLTARHQAREALEKATAGDAGEPGDRQRLATEWLLQPVLASWGNVGGCGVGGAATATGGIKWVGRGVTGGLIDVQCLLTQTFFPGEGDAEQSSFSTRLGTNITPKWSVAATVPFRYNAEDVLNANDDTRRAHLPGFGDVGLEVTRKLGITNAHSLTLSASFPSGAHDAVRQGVVLPQRMQLGSGVVSGGLIYEHTVDQDWGILIFGGNAFYSGWENSVKDFRGSSVGGYAHVGYILGPFVPSVGLTLTGKFQRDAERGVELEGSPYFLATPNLTLEWSIDWLAVLVSASLTLAPEKHPDWIETWMVGMGLQTSLF